MKLEGILPALYTIYDSEGEVTDEGLETLLSFYIERGCGGFFVGGTTGEGFLQSVEERCRYLEAVVKTVAGQVPVVAHVGAMATDDACEIARFAAEAGADAVGSVLPPYFRIGIGAIADYYRAIGEAAQLPLLVYYLSYVAGEPLDAEAFVENLACLPHVFALKYTSSDLMALGQIMDLTDGRLNMLIGADQMLLPALTLGADGGIGTFYCIMPEVFVGVYNHYRAGEIREARRLMAKGFRIAYRLKRKYPTAAMGREVMRMRGLETGRCRRPIPSLSAGRLEELRADLEELDFFSDPIR